MTVAYDQWTAPARFSRFTSLTVACPPVRDADRFLDWLHDFGRRRPGHVLCPTSDDVAFLVAAHRTSLEPVFRLHVPSLQSLVQTLDKSRLTAAAAGAGLDVPRTCSPQNEDDVRQIASRLQMPVLVKPRTQTLSQRGGKGVRVDRAENLIEAWRLVRDRASLHSHALSRMPEWALPIVQDYHAVSERIYTIDGFADASSTIIAALACTKLLQLPRGSGPGVLFEDAPLDDAVLAGLQELCRTTGHVGVFDAEFAVDGNRRLLIDFNPRFYNHMGFEIDRGLPLPWLAYLGAVGDDDTLQRTLAALARAEPTPRLYMHCISTRLLLAVQRYTGRMTTTEHRQWRKRIAASEPAITDPVWSAGDWWPWAADLALLARHPRSLYRKLASGR